VEINCYGCIYGFKFYGREGDLIFDIGKTSSEWHVVELEADEEIIGVVYKRYQNL